MLERLKHSGLQAQVDPIEVRASTFGYFASQIFVRTDPRPQEFLLDISRTDPGQQAASEKIALARSSNHDAPGRFPMPWSLCSNICAQQGPKLALALVSRRTTDRPTKEQGKSLLPSNFPVFTPMGFLKSGFRRS